MWSFDVSGWRVGVQRVGVGVHEAGVGVHHGECVGERDRVGVTVTVFDGVPVWEGVLVELTDADEVALPVELRDPDEVALPDALLDPDNVALADELLDPDDVALGVEVRVQDAAWQISGPLCSLRKPFCRRRRSHSPHVVFCRHEPSIHPHTYWLEP